MSIEFLGLRPNLNSFIEITHLIARQRATKKSSAIEVFILAGGRSSRMGRDKSRLRLGRRTLCGHVRALAHQLGYPARTIRHDLISPCGPLGGIYTALSTSDAKSVLFLSNDMPFVSVNLLRRLTARFKPGVKSLFVTDAGFVGFPFLLSRSVLPAVARQIADERYSLQELAKALDAQVFRVTSRFAAELLNINTPADWAVARLHWRMLTRKNRG